MLITKCSSSAIKSYKSCPFQYYLNQIIKIKTPSGKSAVQGNIVHKTFEWMAKLKKKNKTHIDPLWLLDRAFDEFYHKDLRKFTTRGISADYKRLEKSITTIIDDKYYNPYNLDIIESEKRCELELPGEEWSVTLDGIKKQFNIRGFIDIVYKINNDTLGIIDWKNGKFQDFSTMKTLTYYKLYNEIQPRIYHLLSYMLFPEYKNIVLTFYYINDGGPRTLGFSQEDISTTIDCIKKFFDTVKKDSVMRRNRSWKCRMCPYNKEDICTEIWSELNTLGEKFIKDKYYEINLERLLDV